MSKEELAEFTKAAEENHAIDVRQVLIDALEYSDDEYKLVAHKGKEVSKSGIFYMPYISEHGEPSEQYCELMAQYKSDHEVCPKCGSKGHSSTYMGYVMDMEKPEDYKDLNSCVCSECDYAHKTHDRISKEAFAAITMVATCNKCQTKTRFLYGDDEPDKFGRRCIVCPNCRGFVNVDKILGEMY